MAGTRGTPGSGRPARAASGGRAGRAVWAALAVAVAAAVWWVSATAVVLTAVPAGSGARVAAVAAVALADGSQGAERAKAAGCAGERCWPVAGSGPRGRPEVLRAFDPPAAPWSAGHRGVDVRAGPGTPVRAAAPGRVVFAGPVDRTPVVVVELPGRWRVTYEPVRATLPVGTAVAAGTTVGVLTGVLPHCAPGGPCLHWGLLLDGVYADPLSLLPPVLLRCGPSRLLPVYSAVSG
jgi:murein DD-endopeptidase MepM/ murein hydrolase activator NlpD